jgi:hypothetical protein
VERTHFGQHDDGCFGCKVRSVAIGRASDMPTRKPEAVAAKQYERDREKDIAAYKRLRQDGLKVKGTIGADKLEATARTEFELESGIVAPSASMSREIESAQVELTERMEVHEKEMAAAQ